MRIDLHVHTALCRHATGDAAAMVAAAGEAGLDVVAITDHLPLPDGFGADYAMEPGQLAGYVDEVLRVAEAARAHGGPEVLLGIEADWLPGRDDELAETLAAHPFDLVIGSVHFLDGWAFDDPGLLHEWDERDVDDVWTEYFAAVSDAAGSGLFDVIAHPDLVKKFGHVPTFDPAALYVDAAGAFAAAGVAIEVSTAGLRKPVGEQYPAAAFLSACHQAGVPATTGSDAHCPEEVGYGLDLAARLMRQAGYESVGVFRARRMETVPLGADVA